MVSSTFRVTSSTQIVTKLTSCHTFASQIDGRFLEIFHEINISSANSSVLVWICDWESRALNWIEWGLTKSLFWLLLLNVQEINSTLFIYIVLFLEALNWLWGSEQFLARVHIISCVCAPEFTGTNTSYMQFCHFPWALVWFGSTVWHQKKRRE